MVITMKKALSLLCAAISVISIFTITLSAEEPYSTYTYSYYNEPKLSPHAYETELVFNLKESGCGPLKEPTQILTDARQNIYIADTGNNRIVILDENFNFLKELSHFGEDALNGPCGVFVTADGDIYVGDTENMRIVIFDKDYNVKAIHNKPDAALLPEDFTYKPYALCVDDAKRIYVIAKSTNMGVIELDSKGKFSGFLGAKKVSANLGDIFWRFFMNDEQKSRTLKTVPTEYNNITIDDAGFLFVTTNSMKQYEQYAAIVSRSTSSANLPVSRLNPLGLDVLSRNGFYPPAGDTKFIMGSNTDTDYGPSQILGITLGDYGMYSVLDNKRGKIFTYDNDGNLLYAFGVRGLQKGSFENLISICYKGDRLLALDKKTGGITVFAPTEYQKMIYSAIAAFEEKQYDRASELWSALSKKNANLDMAYIGMGKIHMYNKEYKQAMGYFKLANNKERYSKAYSAYRKEVIEKYALLIPVIVLLAVFILSRILKKIGALNRSASEPKTRPKRFVKRILYAFHTAVHPFDGFWDVKHEKRGGLSAAIFINVLAVLSYCFYSMSSGYIYRDFDITRFNLLFTASYVLLFVMMWSISNCAFTSLMDGEGSFKDIYITVSYSLLPVVLLLPAATVISNFITAEDVYLVNFLVGLSLVWTVALVFFGMMVIHGYTLAKNIISSVLSLAGMLIMLFLGILFFDLIQRIVSYFVNIFIEVTYRF